VKGADGKYSYDGATERVLKIMRTHSNENVQVKAAGGIRNLNQILKVRDLGATRVGATATQTIIEEARTKFK